MGNRNEELEVESQHTDGVGGAVRELELGDIALEHLVHVEAGELLEQVVIGVAQQAVKARVLQLGLAVLLDVAQQPLQEYPRFTLGGFTNLTSCACQQNRSPQAFSMLLSTFPGRQSLQRLHCPGRRLHTRAQACMQAGRAAALATAACVRMQGDRRLPAAHLEHGRHGGALDEGGQEGDDAHEEDAERAEALIRNLLVQQHKQRQRQAHRAAQPRPVTFTRM